MHATVTRLGLKWQTNKESWLFTERGLGFETRITVLGAELELGTSGSRVQRSDHQCLADFDHRKKQDWHYARILGLSICMGVRIISNKIDPEMFAMHLPHPVCTFVCDTSGSKFR